jgi:hypothetical protein
VGGRVLLAATDLGYLLRRCGRVLLRVSGAPTVLPADQLIAWRTLQVVVGTPYLPHVVGALPPGSSLQGTRLSVPIGLEGAEETLAACLAAQLPVTASWIEYRAAASG